MSLKLNILLKQKIVQVITEVVDILVEKGGDTVGTRWCFCKDCIFMLEGTGTEPLAWVRNWEGRLIHDRKRNSLCSLHRSPMPMWELVQCYGWKTAVHEKEDPIACVMWKNLIRK